jgi:hypothetical protein
MLAVLAVFCDANGVSELDATRLHAICTELSASVSDEGALSGAVATVSEQLLNSVLPGDKTSAAACFPIGVLALKVADGSAFDQAELKSLVRASDSVIRVDGGTFVFVLQRASEGSVIAVMDRVKTLCASMSIASRFEWAVLNELTDSTVGDVSSVIATVGARFLGQVSTKLH